VNALSILEFKFNGIALLNCGNDDSCIEKVEPLMGQTVVDQIV
jgi:hypothetical protein